MSDTSQVEPKEKHVPVIENAGENHLPARLVAKRTGRQGVLVKVGSVPHPMLEAHWIEWIELYKDGVLVKHVDLKPGQEPQATFEVEFDSLDQLLAKEHCNLHGTWQSDKQEPVK